MNPTTFEAVGIDTRGRVSGEVKTICPQCSPTRKKSKFPCLNVNIDKRAWHCWHCDWSGGLSDGIAAIRPRIVKTYRKPDYVAQASALPDPVSTWFAGRGIPESVLRRNQIGNGSAYFPQVEAERSCVMFPYLRGSEVVNVKYRTPDKLFRMAGGAERILYGLNDVGASLVWVEGEIDKLSVEVAGIRSCVSVPDGAPAVEAKNYESKFDFLDASEICKAQTHVIAVDNDAPGLKLRDELVRRLGPDQCRIVDWPDGCKDANDTLVQYGADIGAACIADARELPIEGAFDVIDFADEVDTLYTTGVPEGLSTGWGTLDEHYRVRAGDLVVVTGPPNSGKSEWLDALAVNVARLHDWRFGVFSPEQGSPGEHIAKLLEKHIGKPFNPGPVERISVADKDRGMTWLNDHFMMMDPDEPSLDALLSIARRMILRRGIRGLILDPWNEIESTRPREMSETEHIGVSLRTVRRFLRRHQVSGWIVAHPRILQKDPKTGQYPVAGPYEISGSAHWHNKADVCLSIWRERSAGHQKCEVEVHVQKVKSKYAGKLGMTELRWDRVTGRYADLERDERGLAYEFSGLAS